MNEITTARMLMTTAVLAAVAALFAGGANAMLLDAEGGSGSDTTAVAQPGDPGTIPYLSHGIGVDKSLFSGQASTKPTGVHAALQRDHGTESTAVAQPGDPGTIPYLSHGIGVDKSLFSGQTSLGLTGDSARTRVADEPRGLTGDSPIGRFPETTQTAVASGSDDLDWSSFGAGAGLVALVGAGIAGVWLVTRKRGGVALP
jgi:hypothetical protein